MAVAAYLPLTSSREMDASPCFLKRQLKCPGASSGLEVAGPDDGGVSGAHAGESLPLAVADHMKLVLASD